MQILPFKLKKSVCSEFIVESGREFFGSPCQRSVVNNKFIFNWRICDNYSEITLSISYQEGSEFLDLHIDTNPFADDKTINFNLKNYTPKFFDLLGEFVNKIKKPWTDWSIEEIEEDPTWIFCYYSEIGSIPTVLHNRMVLESYKSTNNKYIRKYFDLWKSRN